MLDLRLGDCLEVLKEIPDNSVDAIVTDPPYELGFMGKSWDKTGIANNAEMWSECLRVLKPGGHLLSFGGTRTYHRMAIAIEDAGFEIRDMIEWVYGSGFPKSLNIGKAVDKLQGNEREEIAERGGAIQKGSANWQGQDRKDGKGSGFKEKFIDTKGTSEWEGWGTALKPAHEPICMARKPLSEKNVAENCLKWGTGGINIDGSRVETNSEVDDPRLGGKGEWHIKRTPDGHTVSMPAMDMGSSPLGRFPANLIHDNSEEVRECFPESGGGKFSKSGNRVGGNCEYSVGINGRKDAPDNYGDSGNASRFFKSIIYTSKASKRERNEGCEEMPQTYKSRIWAQSKLSKTNFGSQQNKYPTTNNHPTVKPVKLMEYLINMVTREGQIVLDPFMGSGTTGVACKRLNRNFIGIELSEEYMTIARSRIGV